MNLIILFISILVTVCHCTGMGDYEEEKNLDETASKYLSTVAAHLTILNKTEGSQMIFSECNFEKSDLKQIIISVTRAMDFFTLHLHDLVLDAAIGTRLLQTQLKLVQDGHPTLSTSLLMYLTNLQLQSELLSELIIESVSDSTQFSKLSKQEQLPWVLNSSLWEQPEIGGWQSVNVLNGNLNNNFSSYKEFNRDIEVLTEEISDRCVAELFNGCRVTENCTKIFTETPHSAYSLTHQVLFFLIAAKQNCFQNENFKNQIQDKSPNKFMDKLCTNVLLEANFIQQSNYPPTYRDLLSEQITVCAVAGYPNFLKKNWLTEILSWQNKGAIGCFSFSDNVEEDPLEEEKETLARMELSQKKEKIAAMSLSRLLSKNRRVKRSDEFVKIGKKNCSVHFTAVSLGALSMYLRYFIDTCLVNY